MSFFTDVGSYDLERIADLKSMINYGRRTVSRLQEELKILNQTIEKEVLIIDNVNTLFATSKASSYCTNHQSPVYQALAKEAIPSSNEDESTEIVEPEYPLFKYPNTEEILENLKQSIDFQDFFRTYPLGFLTFFVNSPILFNTDTLILEVETWETDRRTKFFSSFFDHLNSVAFYFSSFLQIVESRSISLLSEYIETGLSSILNCQKIAFFLYDAEEQELVMEKQKLQMRRKLQNGIVSNSLMKNEQSLVSNHFTGVSKEDLSLLKNNKTFLSIPIYSDGIPKALLLFYDKIGGFGTFDYLIGSVLSRFIGQTLPIMKQRNERETSLSNFSNSLTIFLKIIGSRDLDTFLDVIHNTFSEYFQCECSKLYQISSDFSFFTQITKEGSNEKNLINNCLIGRAIQQKKTIKIMNPELSDSFSPLIDRPTPNCISRSLLISPILEEIDHKPTFVIVLFNKKEIDSFTDVDVERIKMIGEHLNNILASLLNTSHLTIHAMHGTQKLVLYKSMFSMLHDLSSPDSFKESSNVMKNSINNSFPDNVIDLFYIDHFNKLIKSTNDNIENRLSYDNPDPIIHFATTSETKEAKKDEESTIYSGLRDLSKRPIGLMKINALSSQNGYGGVSMYDSFSTFSGDSTLSRLDSRTSCPPSARHKFGKSSVQKKVDKLHHIQDSQYNDIKNKHLSNIVNIWHDLLGPVLELSIHRYNTLHMIRLGDNLIEKLPSDPKLAVSIFEEMQYMMNSTEKNSVDGLQMIFIDKNDEYYHKTRNMLISFRLLLSSSQIDVPNKTDEIDQISINNSTSSYLLDISNFNVFNMKPDIFNDFILSVLSDFHILRFLSIDRNIAMVLINNLKSMHVTTDISFKSWELVVDHIQFLSYILKHHGKVLSIPIEKVSALFLYFMSLYCIPYQNDPLLNNQNDKHYSQSELVRKYYIENGKEMSPLSCFIAAVSGLPNPSVIKNETIDILAPLLKELEKSQSFGFLNTSDTSCYLATLSHFSYFARLHDISKQWHDLRYREEFEYEDDDLMKEQVMKFQLDLELKTIILPTFAEFSKKGIQLDSVKKMITSTIQKFV